MKTDDAVTLALPFAPEQHARCPHTGRVAVSLQDRLSVYSMRALSCPKFTTSLCSPIVCLQSGFKWRHEEPCLFASTLDRHLCIVSCVDGALLQSLQCPGVVEAMSWLDGCLAVLIQQTCFWTLDCDGVLDDEQATFSAHFTRMHTGMQVKDIALVECMAGWPIHRQRQMMLACVGECPDAQLVMLPVRAQAGIIGRLSSMLLSSPSLHSPDHKYYECGRHFDRVQAVGERVFCFDDHRGSLTVFQADTLLISHHKKGMRGAVAVDADTVFHARSSRTVSLADDAVGRVAGNLLLLPARDGDRAVLIKHG